MIYGSLTSLVSNLDEIVMTLFHGNRILTCLWSCVKSLFVSVPVRVSLRLTNVAYHKSPDLWVPQQCIYANSSLET